MEYLGNKEILDNYKIGFLCSRKVPVNIILKIYDWAIEQRDKGVCVVSGFHSKIERDVFYYLLKGNQPIILVLARGMYKLVPPELRYEVEKGRLIIISSFNEKVSRASEQISLRRNKYIVDISDELYIPYASSNGSLEKVILFAQSLGKRLIMK